MKFYIDQRTGIVYEVTREMPSFDKLKSQLTVRALTLYGMYRNGLYDTRIAKPLDADIAVFEPKYDYDHTKACAANASNHLYHYASHVAIDALQELFKHEKGQCCTAYRMMGNRKIPVGFLVFYEKIVEAQKIVYISHVSVGPFRKGIGTKLIQAVLMIYPADTVFYLCARRTNEDAHRVYQHIGFNPDSQYLQPFGYNPQYFIGMSHRTTPEQLKEIKCHFTENAQRNQQSYFHQRLLTSVPMMLEELSGQSAAKDENYNSSQCYR